MIRVILGHVLKIEALFMLLPCIVSLIYGEKQGYTYLIVAGFCALVGVLMSLIKKPKDTALYLKEGCVATALSWILLSLFGALPFWITGEIPSYVDSLFETISGFTTTGSSILTDIESLDNAMLFWRSFTHWIGGMGILVFSMIIIPLGGKRSMYILRAEAPGPSSSKLVPKMRDTAAILYGIYFAMSAVLLVLLLAGGMPLFDCFINVFGTAGTGGFSNHGASIGHYDNVYFETVIGIFMLLFGVNFNLYYLIFLKRARAAVRSEELHWYLGIVAFAVITIAININSLYGSFQQAGSTGGGLKVSRVMLLLRTARRSMRRMIHSRSVESIRFDGRIMEEETLTTCLIYLTIYCLVTVASVVLVSLNNFPFEVNVTAVVACINNIGPGLGMVGPAGNFASFSGASKLVLAFDMLAGRLELFPVLFLFSVRTWKR